MARKMTAEEKKEYDRLTKDAEQIRLKMDELMNKPTVYGYLRVSSKGQARDGNSLEAQKRDLEAAGAEVLYTDIYTGTTTDRPELDKLIGELKDGDTIIVTKLDRIARSVQQGIELIQSNGNTYFCQSKRNKVLRFGWKFSNFFHNKKSPLNAGFFAYVR